MEPVRARPVLLPSLRLTAPAQAPPAPEEAREVPVLPVVLAAAGAVVARAALAGTGWGLAASAAGAAIGGMVGYFLPRWLTPEGPRLIVGHVGEREARLWGRGDAKNSVMTAQVLESDRVVSSAQVQLQAETGYTGAVTLNGLEPGREYRCRVDYGSYQETGSFRTDDKNAEEVSFLMGSCNNHRFWRRGEAWERIEALAEQTKPDFLLHTGDQIYADQPYQSHGLEGFRGCYRRAWSDPEARELLKEHPNYMILDDHEVGNGFAQHQPLSPIRRAWLWLSGLWGSEPAQRQSLERAGLQAYAEFQHSHNPHPFGEEKRYYTFSRGPAEFFVLDTTTERNPARGEMIGSEQLQRLRDWLSTNRDRPRFVVSSVPFLAEQTSKDPEARWSSSAFRGQRDALLDFVAREGLKGVVFLSGDSHNSFHMETDLGTTRVHELGASPINGWVLRGPEIYQSKRTDRTAAGTDYTTELDSQHFLGTRSYGSRETSACMKIRTDGDEVEFSIHRTHRDDEGAYSTGRFSLGLPPACKAESPPSA